MVGCGPLRRPHTSGATPSRCGIARSTPAGWSWRWDEGALAAADPVEGPARATLAPCTVYSDPSGEHAEDHPGGPVCLDRVHGPVGTGEGFLVEVGPCGATDGVRGYAESQHITLADPVHTELFGTWPDPPSKPVRFDWDRP